MFLEPLRGWTKEQRNAVIASYLGWTLDAFDFFLLIFVVTDIAKEFDASVATVSIAITLTLAFRPLGALIFGRLADRYGRKPVMMADVLLYAGFGFLTAFVPSLFALFVVRALFGIAMGGEWGVGASLTMESIPRRSRGLVSGLLQAGYPSGLLLASAVYGLFYTHIGWRGMFMLGIAPALLVLYIRRSVNEPPAWKSVPIGFAWRFTPARILIYLAAIAAASAATTLLYPDLGWWAGVVTFGPVAAGIAFYNSPLLQRHWRLAVYAMVFMMAMNFFSHGTQDLYPTMLKVDHGLGHGIVSQINIIAAIGAIIGGLTFGSLSQVIGRRRALILGALLALPVIPLWAFSQDVWLLGAAGFVMQFMVQGCWGIIPAHLNELSPGEARGTFPGVVYQLGNFLASYNATLQADMTIRYGSYGAALALIAGIAAIAIAALALTGQEARDVDMEASRPHPART
ncbi:MAG TPA: MFS transporter [Rhizomicrobium sp.]|nr:MFS transporter [Rhizomicrobium sp.]